MSFYQIQKMNIFKTIMQNREAGEWCPENILRLKKIKKIGFF